MAKRFIDTGIFDAEWFMNLSKDAKLLWLYFITKCDHAGILKMNEKLCKVQTEIKDLERVIKELGNHLLRVTGTTFFIPKFIEFQYPDFPHSKVRQQQSALEILKKYNLFDNEKLIVIKELVNTYEHVNVNVNVNVIDNVNENEESEISKIEIAFEDFWGIYDYKVGPIDKVKKKWFSLSNQERAAAMAYIPQYKVSKPDKQFRRQPHSFLNQKTWNDELVFPKSQKRNGQRVIIPEQDHSLPQTF